jgi:DNA mismatch repair protein MutS2
MSNNSNSLISSNNSNSTIPKKNSSLIGLNRLDWNEIIERLEKMATSEPARSLLRKMMPLATVAEAEASFRAIQDSREVLSRGERPFMESLDLFQTWFQRLKRQAVLQTMELRDVRHFCIEAVALLEVLKPHNNIWSQTQKTRMMDATEPLSAIDQIMTPSGEIRSDASETLFNLYREKAQQTKSLQSTLDRFTKKWDMEPILQDRYVTTREGRWVIPVKSGMQHAFPGIIHSSSQSKQTVFMEPDEVIPLNNRIRQIDIEIEAEIERILNSLSAYLLTELGGFHASYDTMLEADLRFAQGKLCEALQAHPVEFSESELELIDVRHPVLALKSDNVIPNTVRLGGERRVLLLSGPNAGGKTVLLKSVGLASQMARCGLPICAESGSKLPFFTDLFIGVGDAQSVDEHLSTFAAHLKVLDEATHAKGGDKLVLIDEICGSTDPEEGSALARSFIETYARNGVYAVITSHLGPLKTGWKPEGGVTNGSLEYNAQSGQPTYQFFMGVPGQSLALQTARRVGVNAQIIDQALNYLSPETKLQHEHLREIEKMKEELQDLRRQLYEDSKEARTLKRKYQEMIQNFRRERDQWLQRSIKKAEKKIDALIDFNSVDHLFKKHEKLQQIKHDLPEVVKASTQMATRTKLETPADFESAYPSGSIVFIPSVGQEGVIQGSVNSKGEVPVLANSMRLYVHWQQLRPPQSLQNPTQKIMRRSSGVSVTLQDLDRVIDVRGKSVEDAISILETQLDKSSLAQEDRIKIVHGHGTETLKRAIRAHLSRSIYVKKWKAGPADGGGDGITFAELKD